MRERIGLVPVYDTDETTVERYRLPRPTPGNTMRAISQRLLHLCGVKPEFATHYVGIIGGGTGIAGAVSVVHELSQPFALTGYSYIDLKKPNNLIFSPDTDETPLRTILIDNSIRTGATIQAALSLLTANEVHVNDVVSLVRYGTEQEASIVQRIETEHSTNVTFLFDVSEVDAVSNDATW
jgi:orotate phosphoribosyltransferase